MLKRAGFKLRRYIGLVVLALSGTLFAAQTPKLIYQCAFKKDMWNVDDWTLVKSPRWKHAGSWIQNTDCIENTTPKEATPDSMLSERAGETYTSMIFKQKVKGGNKKMVTITSTMSFAYRMAPTIVIAPELGIAGEGGLEYREHWEIVLYDGGINVWHHTFEDGQPAWEKVAYCKFDLAPMSKYQLTVVKNDKRLEISVDGKSFGFVDANLPDEFYTGITASEGVNRFYDFKIESL